MPNKLAIPDLEKATATAVGAVLGVTCRGVGQWLKRNGCPRNKDGTYDVRAMVVWYVEREVKRAVEKALKGAKGRVVGEEGEGDLEHHRTRRMKANADLRELDVAKRRGELILADLARRDQIEQAAIYKQNLLALPARAAGQSFGRKKGEIEAILTEAVEAVLRNLVR